MLLKTIEEWIVYARIHGYEWLIVACDTFNFETYPIYCLTEQEMVQDRSRFNPLDEWSKLMEIYHIDNDAEERARSVGNVRDDIERGVYARQS